MSYRIEVGESVQEAVRRIAREQIEKAIDDAADSKLDLDERVHEVRKRGKKVRALLRLARPSFEDTYARENAFFRDAARELAALRDATSRIEALEKIETPLASVRDLLVSRRGALYEELGAETRLEAFRDAMKDARERVSAWELDGEGFAAVGPGTAKTYRRGRKAMRRARESGTLEDFHEWRKRVKYHRYHVRLLRNLWEPVLAGRRSALKRLSDLLGDAHDLGELRAWLARKATTAVSSSELELALGLLDAERKRLEALAFPLGSRVYVAKPKRWRKRARVYWESWKVENALAGVFRC